METLDYFAINWTFLADNVVRIILAYLLALPIGWERERSERSAGLRTFPLVAVAACAYITAGSYLFETDEAQARVIQGLITGMGFIGGGAILKSGANVIGTATAASMWTVGAIGLCVAIGLLELAIVLSISNCVILWFLRGSKKPTTEADSGIDLKNHS